MKLKNCTLAMLALFIVSIFSTQAVAYDEARYLEYRQRTESAALEETVTHDLAPEVDLAPGVMNNGGFETGDFTGWVAGDNADGEVMTGLTPWTVSTSGMYFPGTPVEGSYFALNGFDGSAGYEAYLYQDITIPAEGGGVSFSDNITYDIFAGTLPRVYEVQVRDLSNNILQVLFHYESPLNGNDELGWQQRSFDLSGFAGQTVRLYIQLSIPESYTGPAEIQFDNFQLTAGSGGASNLIISPASGNLPTTQRFDLTLTAKTNGLTVVRVDSADVDGVNVTWQFNNLAIPGVLTSGTGETLRIKNFSGLMQRGGLLVEGSHTLNVTLELSDGSTVNNSATWSVEETVE